MRDKSRLVNLLAGVTTAFFVQNVSAQDDDSGPFEEIVVTATKRPQPLQDVGISMVALTSDTLSRNIVTDIRDIGRISAGVEFTGGSNGVDPFVVIRGVSMQATGPANAPANSVHVDEVPYSRSQFLNFPIFDLERVEVLKGPQGTLFGLAATGGTVNLITKKPTEEAEGYVNLSYGDFDEIGLEAAFGGPLTDTIQGRLAIKYQQSDGYYKSFGMSLVDPASIPVLATDQFDFTGVLADPRYGVTPADLLPGGFVQDSYTLLRQDILDGINTIGVDNNYGDLDKFALRGSLASQWGDNVDVLLQLSYYTDDSEILQRELEGVDGTFIGTDGLPLRDRAGNPMPAEQFAISHNIADPTYDHRHLGLMLRFDIDVDFATLTSVTGFNDLDRVVRDNTDVSALPAQEQFMTTKVQVITQEIRLASNSGGDFYWTGGFFFMNDQLSAKVDTPFRYKSANRLGGDFFTAYTEDVALWAVFANLEYNVTDEFKLIGGARLNDENRQYAVQAFDGNPFGFRNAMGVTLLEVTSTGQLPLERATPVNESNVTWKIGAEWAPNDRVLLYANYSTGQSAAGFDGSAVTGLAEAIIPVLGEEVTAFEIGFKTEWPELGIRFNGAIFTADNEDIRISVQEKIFLGIFDPVTGEELFTQGGVLVNAGKAEIDGAEFELQWVANDFFGIDANVSILDTEIVEFTGNRIANTPEAIAAIEGSRLPDAPELTYRVGVWTDIPIGDYRLSASLNYIYRDEAFTRTPSEDPRKLVADYNLTNARVDFAPEDGPWSVGIWARNLFDEEYATALDGGEGANGYRRITRGAPRTVGVQLQYQF